MAEQSLEAGPRLRRSAFALLVALLAAALTLAACGGDDNGSGGGGSSSQANKPATLNVGVIPIADVAPLYLGIKKGFFKEQNLTVNPKLAEGGAAITPAVLSGDFQIGFSNNISLLIASSKGLPVQVISQGVLGGKDKSEAWADLLVLKDGPIKNGKDLEGKTIAVNTLKNICEVTIKASLQKEGVDVNKLKWIEVPFPDMNAALESGRVDAAFQVEPGYSGGLAAGSKNLVNAYEEMAENYTVATYFASKQYIAENRDVVDRFVRAMEKSLDHASSHPDQVRAIVGTYTEIPQEVLDQMNLPVWKADLNEPTIEQTAEKAKEYGFIEESPDLDALILRD